MGYKVVCAGEALVDLVTDTYVDDLARGRAFEPHVGGSPANLASNLRSLGVEAALVAAVGTDGFGQLVVEQLAARGLSTDSVGRVGSAPTTLVLVAKSTRTPDFAVYRGADAHLSWAPFARLLAGGGVRLFHTTCFALSGLPARSHLLRAAAAFAKTGATVSLDANYAPEVWPDRARAQAVVRSYCEHGALVKMSEDDFARLYGRPLRPDDCAAEGETLLSAGARLVCFTFGAAGAVAVAPDGLVRVQAPALEIVDATGAGDAYWAGFLAAYLDGRAPRACLEAGNRVAATKLTQQGPLRGAVEWR